MGLDYATHGTMMVAGRKLVVIEKDSQTKPDVGRNVLNEAYNDDGADIAVGGTYSAVALAMLPVAQDNKKILIVEPAVANSITGDKWNRYIFRTARNSTQDAISNALAIGKPGTVVATLAQDYAFGRDFVTAFKQALIPTGAKLVFEEYAPPATTDFTASYQRIFDALAKYQGRKIIFLNWAGGGNPMSALKALDPSRLGISVATGGNILPALVAYKDFPGLEGSAYYYYEIPKNPVNDWLVAENKKRFNGAPPDFFTCGGFIAAQAVVEALTKDRRFDRYGEADRPRWKVWPGNRRKEGYSSARKTISFMQPMYGFKIKVDPKVAWAISGTHTGHPDRRDESTHHQRPPLVWRFRSPHHFCRELVMRTSEPKPH